MPKADAGAARKRETQRERVARAIYAVSPVGERDWPDAPATTRKICFDVADAALAAAPDPYLKKERDRPKLPTDDCVLCAMRGEFADLVAFVESHGTEGDTAWPGAFALARALKEQGVV